MNTSVTLRKFGADDADWLVAQHRELCAKAEGFDASFGGLVPQIIHDFLAEHDPIMERGWIVEQSWEIDL